MTTHGHNCSRYHQTLLNYHDTVSHLSDKQLSYLTEQLKQITDRAIQLGEFILANNISDAKQQSNIFKAMYGQWLPAHLKKPV